MRPLSPAELDVFRARLRDVVGSLAEAPCEEGLAAAAASARPFSHSADSPCDAVLVGIDGGGISPLLELGDRAVHAITLSRARFSASAGARGLRAEGIETRLSLHVVGGGQPKGPLEGARGLSAEPVLRSLEEASRPRTGPHSLPSSGDHASWGALLRTCGEWALAQDEPGSLVLLDSTFTPPPGPPWARAAVAGFRAWVERACFESGATCLAVSKGVGVRNLAALAEKLEASGLSGHWFLPLSAAAEGAPRAYLVRFHGPVLRIEGRLPRDPEPLFSLLDHATHAEGALGYPYPLREAHVACVVDRSARALLTHAVSEELRRLGLPRDLLIGPARRSGHAPRR
jgi:hypothetical protein